MELKDRIILDLPVRRMDRLNAVQAIAAVVRSFEPHVGFFRISQHVALAVGVPQAVRVIKNSGGKVFLDLNFYTGAREAEGVVTEAMRLGVEMLSVSCMSGPLVLGKIREAMNVRACHKPLLIGVASLENLSHPSFSAQSSPCQDARIASQAALDGIMVPHHSVRSVRRVMGRCPFIISSGISPFSESFTELAVSQAISEGASHVLIGEEAVSAEGDGTASLLQRVAQGLSCHSDVYARELSVA